jgi:YVTN family beta-propeller protein
MTAVLLGLAALVLAGCNGGNNNNPSTVIQLQDTECIWDKAVYDSQHVKQCLPHTTIGVPGIRVSGARQQDETGAQGNVISFGAAFNGPIVTTQLAPGGALAGVNINGARIPAIWKFEWDWPYSCGPTYSNSYTDPDNPYSLWYRYEDPSVDMHAPDHLGWAFTCLLDPNQIKGSSTHFAVAGSFPSSITLTGSAAFSTQNGMPLLRVYDQNNNLVATQTATSVSADATQATFPFPSNLAQSGYALVPQNRIPETPGYAPAGLNLLSIAQSQTISGNPFGVAAGDQTTQTVNCVYVQVGTPPHVYMSTQCTQSTAAPVPVPVVSLYSANQVLVGSTRVNVGTNPTAVATYNGSAVSTTTNNSNGYVITIRSGATRAIVTNSGANTVTILDTIADTPIATVTVGNRPVAVAVSADSSAAYVANYADSTISRVNLSTNTPTGTVTVGGRPTSVTLASDGTLWVGGAGFLSKVNTSTMTVTGTETVQNKNIIALSYSNTLGQLIVQSNDTTGAVYQDEMNPTSFSAGGTYAALSSHTVSTLGSYPVGSLQVRAFTSTLSQSSSLPINLPGAPPLVVQDDWLVVTATPTGFTVTDANDHIVLISQTTASPVAAIAVDPKLNIAYLTEPDSNILLTVPLPGTGSN